MTEHFLSSEPLVLASGSAARRAMLEAVGIQLIIQPAAVDEEEVKASCRAAGLTAMETAEALAETKAKRVAASYPDQYVLGCDQIMALEDGDRVRWFDKPRDLAELADHLRAISGKVHTLETATVLLNKGARIWHQVARPRLKVRSLSEAFIEQYVSAAGPDLLSCVGGYQIEALGPHLEQFIPRRDAESTGRAFGAQDQDRAVRHRGDESRVGDRHHGRRVDNDPVVLFGQDGDRLGEDPVREEFDGVGRPVAARQEIKPLDLGWLDDFAGRLGARQDRGEPRFCVGIEDRVLGWLPQV
ncbi:MAG: Maf family protein, partial [Pseudomonadota bacterium]